MKMTIKQFFRKHSGCPEAETWATETCQTMDEVWDSAKPEWLIWVATREGVLTDKEERAFVVWSARQVQHLMTDDRSIAAIDVAERYATGDAIDEELEAVWVATIGSAWGADWWAAVSVACEAVRAAQAQYLRENYKPNCEI